jgi:hypothetical protein
MREPRRQRRKSRISGALWKKKTNRKTGGAGSPSEAGPRTARKLSEKETAAAGSPREAGPRMARLRAKAVGRKTSGGGAIRDENRKKSREPRNLAPSTDQMKTETQHDEKNAHGGACETESNSGSLSGEETRTRLVAARYREGKEHGCHSNPSTALTEPRSGPGLNAGWRTRGQMDPPVEKSKRGCTWSDPRPKINTENEALRFKTIRPRTKQTQNFSNKNPT